MLKCDSGEIKKKREIKLYSIVEIWCEALFWYEKKKISCPNGTVRAMHNNVINMRRVHLVIIREIFIFLSDRIIAESHSSSSVVVVVVYLARSFNEIMKSVEMNNFTLSDTH